MPVDDHMTLKDATMEIQLYHIIGYEHTFINQAADVMMVLGGKEPTIPLSDFEDAFQTQRVLEAVTISAEHRRPVQLSEVL